MASSNQMQRKSNEPHTSERQLRYMIEASIAISTAQLLSGSLGQDQPFNRLEYQVIDVE